MELAKLIGASARSHRTAYGTTLDEVAREARQLGLKWSSSRAGDFEAGRVAASLSTVVAAAAAYSAATKQSLTIPAMLATDEDGPTALKLQSGHRVDVTPVLLMRADRLAEILAGDDPTPVAGDMMDDKELEALMSKAFTGTHAVVTAGFGDVPLQAMVAASETSGLATRRVAADLDVHPQVVVAASADLWGRSLEEERDRLAGRDASPQKRGHIMRTLKAELAETISVKKGGVEDER